jgi:hypothetical protein
MKVSKQVLSALKLEKVMEVNGLGSMKMDRTLVRTDTQLPHHIMKQNKELLKTFMLKMNQILICLREKMLTFMNTTEGSKLLYLQVKLMTK